MALAARDLERDRRGRVRDGSPAAIVDLVRAQAEALDLAAEVLELRADARIAEVRLARHLEQLDRLAGAARGLPGYVPADLARLLRSPDAAALRAAARRYRSLAEFEKGNITRPSSAA